MASNPQDGQPGPGDKTLHVWSKPIEQNEAAAGTGENGATSTNNRPTISEAVSMIKKDDFANVANTPCARQGFITGIASGAGVGGLRTRAKGSSGNPGNAANWAVGIFVLGSMASYEWCQYLRREERRQMKRHIEVVSENRREQARKIQEARREHDKLEAEKKLTEKPWYKVW
ncbi:Cytochrome c oxidase protein 20, mitochondrial [Fusarium austroafricanum]|uniref:Cytochrome c oxidase assembly protein COX20, mitochondrial n=1 Tax=Fusarium austroafricanum TaxID=2364996 RepID=A0A8H4NYW3_9HYPO|nr:Cytochrome c oxidase protein 20, mitochondrial [Fusarium austroafricanum]